MAENNIFDEAVPPASTERTMKMTFSISPQDRILVKTYAIRRNLTVSDLFHKWINEFCSE